MLHELSFPIGLKLKNYPENCQRNLRDSFFTVQFSGHSSNRAFFNHILICLFSLFFVVGDDVLIFIKRIIENHFADVVAVFDDFFVGNRCDFVACR